MRERNTHISDAEVEALLDRAKKEYRDDIFGNYRTYAIKYILWDIGISEVKPSRSPFPLFVDVYYVEAMRIEVTIDRWMKEMQIWPYNKHE